MKILTGIRLINWHYFADETIRLTGSTLITGDNGTGKSTILDAIQFALVGDARKVRFNVSAHDQSRRSLDGYLRGKVGEGEVAVYLRTGHDFTTYVVLEFQDTRRGRPFLLGVGIDSYASGDHADPVFFKVEDQGLDDRLWLEGRRPRSARHGLRPALQRLKGATVYASAEQYRRDVRTKLGHLDDRFFSVLTRAIGFQPIADLRQFVYDYVLEPRPAHVEAMRDNLLQYRQFERLAAQAREKLAALEAIRSRYEECRRLEHVIAVQEFLIRQARLGEAEARQVAVEEELAAARREAARVAEELAGLEARAGEVARELQDLYDARARDDAYLRLRDLDERLRSLAAEEARLEAWAQEVSRHARQQREDLRRMAALLGQEAPGWGLDPVRVQAAQDLLARLGDLLAPAATGDWAQEVPEAALAAALAELEALVDEVRKVRFRLEQEEAALAQEAEALAQEIRRLGERRLTYGEPVERLRALIRERVGAEPRVLCELLEIPDETWQNAVEGYLNTQRFDLLVPPDRFDAALAVYEREKAAHRIHGVGLVNTGALLRERPRREPGSLAEEVVTEDPAARAYVDRLLGRVMKARDEQELKRFPVAITPTCMTYRNHTARQIDFAVYQLWYIGQRAFRRQREVKEARLREVEAARRDRRRALERAVDFLSLAGGRQDRWLLERWQAVRRLPDLRAQRTALQRERAEVDTARLEAIQRAIARLEAEQADLRKREGKLREQVGEWRTRAASLEQELASAQQRVAELAAQVEEFARSHPDAARAGAARYQEERAQRDDAAIARSYLANQETLKSRLANEWQKLVELRSAYNQRYQFGGAPGAPDNAAYDQEAARLRESELPQYEERIARAREQAEQQFKEHFVARLREAIEEALGQFRQLNQVLREIEFGHDRYEFIHPPRQDLRRFYEMIMDPLLLEGHNLFSAAFRERYQDVLDELFARILEGPEEEQLRNIAFYTDYRNYLDYDIRIHHRTGETSLFSRVAREKSGGETQTPYYVIIIASFLQLYRPGQRGGEDTARLMLFDEAFNRMDPDRAEKTLDLMRTLGLQPIIAAPTDKCEMLAPRVETTLLVLRDGHRAWVEPYHQVLAGAAGAGLLEQEAAVAAEPGGAAAPGGGER